jgi:hypothetical protein
MMVIAMAADEWPQGAFNRWFIVYPKKTGVLYQPAKSSTRHCEFHTGPRPTRPG